MATKMTANAQFRPRSVLLNEIRAQLTTDGFPRLTILFILIASGACAFLFSMAALWAGLESMGVRYLLDALVGYGAFLLLIRGWIAYRRGITSDSSYLDLVPDPFTDLAFELSSPGPIHGTGSAPSSHTTLRAPGEADPLEVATDAVGGSLDLDELWWVVLGALLTLGALVAIVYVMYIAPLLLAEVALDAALVSTVYRRLRRQDAGYWAGAVLRRTWVPALVLAGFVTAIGFLMQAAVPDARSIGDVFRAI